MKLSVALLICVCLMLSLASCSANEPAPTTVQTPTTAAPTETTVPTTQLDATADYDALLSCVSMPLITETAYSNSSAAIFNYNYQNISVILPDGDIAEAITLDMLNRIDATIAAADQIKAAAQNEYAEQSDWYPYSYSILYKVARLDQNVLSFYGYETAFDGSSRTTAAPTSTNYDLATGYALSLRTIFYEEYSNDALCNLIIDGLSGYANGELFSDYQDLIQLKFSTNTPIESWYFSNEGLCFYFSPYEIGAYSAGTIVSTIPYHKLSGLLREAYFPVEQPVYSGSPVFLPINTENAAVLDRFTQFGEVILNENSEKLLISIDGSVSDLRISLSTDNPQTNGTMIYAAAGMGPQDATIVEAPTQSFANLVIFYNSDGETATVSP